jgi:transcriptional regulator with XRE-family HTH domain
MSKGGKSRKELAEELGVTKGYVSQLLNGNFNGTVSKLVELSLAANKVPVIKFVDIDDYIAMDQQQIDAIMESIPSVTAFADGKRVEPESVKIKKLEQNNSTCTNIYSELIKVTMASEDCNHKHANSIRRLQTQA